MVKKKILGLMALFLISVSAFAANKVPALKGRVNDYAKIIRDSDEREIEEYLYSVEQSTGIQLAVLTMPTLDGEDIASFGFRVADEWKLGNKEKDNGAILIVAYAEHDLRIEVGDGLEASLTDAKCGLIIRNVIVPEFRDGDYSEGILKGVKNMGAIVTGDESAISRSVCEGENGSSSNDLVPVFAILVWLIFFICTITAGTRRGRGRRRGRYYYNGNTMAWIAADAALRTIMKSGGSSHSSGFGGGSSHSSGSFGGFHGGGGHFSGGGASGHW